MSAAASRLEIESPSSERTNDFDQIEVPEAERELLERLANTYPPTSSGSIIAVDMDDVLSETNHAISQWHNENYGTQMDVSTFYYYYYWKNPFWGTIKETFEKVTRFYETDWIYHAKPVPGSREGVQALKELGFRLVIVTARHQDTKDRSWEWVNKHFPGVFDSVICTGQFKDAHKNGATGHEVVTKLSKAQVCADLKAKLLIDDSSENALQCATAPTNPTPVLLFGNYL